MSKTKAEQEIFTFKHSNGDVFTYENTKHEYTLNGVELPGTTTPLKLVNELTWDNTGKMTDKSMIYQMGAIKKVANYIIEKTKVGMFSGKQVEEIVLEAKKVPNQHFKDAGVSGTDIHNECELFIKDCINNQQVTREVSKQTTNFINWANKNKVKFLFSEEPIYSKEWMNCGTVDFICEIDGKILIGDIKTNGNERRFEWDAKNNKYDFSKPQSNIDIKALWQTGCYGKMATEDNARKLIDKFDGVVIVNIMKSGEFDESLDVKFDYNVTSLVEAYELVIKLYKVFRSKIIN